MALTRSALSSAFIKYEKLAGNVLPTNMDVLNHYYFESKRLSETNPKFTRKAPAFNDVKEKVVQDVADLWMKANLPTVNLIRIKTKLKELIKKFNLTRKRAKKITKCDIFDEDWLTNLFDVCKCKCSIEENPSLKNKKLACSCVFEDQIPSEEIDFLKD
ncbi:unnamed protein product [Clavelina lepadiformis]|uniref:Uncharacterized protein n=1 Tax=Clavelina lepadiformis TaxID=159417 RepID=A0ABP0F935_CLALP